MDKKTIKRVREYLDRIEFHSSGVHGEIMFIKEIVKEEEERNFKTSFRVKNYWKENPQNKTSGFKPKTQ